jgi:hypothetical protein
MIQRIQPVYLFIVFHFCTLLFFYSQRDLEFGWNAVYHVEFGDIISTDENYLGAVFSIS